MTPHLEEKGFYRTSCILAIIIYFKKVYTAPYVQVITENKHLELNQLSDGESFGSATRKKKIS